jgi:hypothetical protein
MNATQMHDQERDVTMDARSRLFGSPRSSSTRMVYLPATLLLALFCCQCGDDDQSTDICGVGEDLAISGASACVYDSALVIETQFRCPAERPNRQQVNGLIVCCDRAGLSQEELDELENQYRNHHPQDEEPDAPLDQADASDAGEIDASLDQLDGPDYETEPPDCSWISEECSDAGWDGTSTYLCIGTDQYTCALACSPECGCDQQLELVEANAADCTVDCETITCGCAESAITSEDHLYCGDGDIQLCQPTWIEACEAWSCTSIAQDECPYGCGASMDGPSVACCPHLSTECADAGWDGMSTTMCIGADLYSCALACWPDCGCDELLVLEQEASPDCQ